jgi:hypothetical protein
MRREDEECKHVSRIGLVGKVSAAYDNSQWTRSPRSGVSTRERRRVSHDLSIGVLTVATTDRINGTLLGTALGDALGLAAEGMSARAIARQFGPVERFHLIGRR